MATEETSTPSPIRKKIFLLYPYYWPLYKGGGPVQSLFNIAATFRSQVDFFIISSDRDIDGSQPDKPIKTREWVKGPNEENIYFVQSISLPILYRLIKEVNPDVIFINGIFNVRTTVPGLILGKILHKKIIISPRGMLQAWGLKRNSLVKKVFLVLLKLSLNKIEVWHATDQQEQGDIFRIFGPKQQVYIASNIPRKVNPLQEIMFPTVEGKIKLVFLSLINPNKNLHLVIEAVNKLAGQFTLDIYGPVIDENYWELCQSKILHPESIQYKGPIPPWDVPAILSRYHFFVLPTQGENFGHAIFDALASGVPVIVSRNTPWKGIDTRQAGYYMDLKEPHSLDEILDTVSNLAPAAYGHLRKQSLAYAEGYWSKKDYGKEYEFLVGGYHASSPHPIPIAIGTLS